MRAQMTEITESPVYLVFDPSLTPGRKDLPVTLFETGAFPHGVSPSFPFALNTVNPTARSLKRPAAFLASASHAVRPPLSV